MSPAEAQAIRQWVVDRMTVVLDNNDQRRYEQIKQAAREAVIEDMGLGTANEREQFLEAVRTSGTAAYALPVGARVCDLIRGWLTEALGDDTLQTAVLDVLDLSDRQLQVLFGEHYMPEAGDFDDEEAQ